MRLIFSSLVVLWIGTLTPLLAQPDTTYVETYPGTWSLRAYSIVKAQQLTLNSSTDATVRYLPDNIFGLGLGISYKILVLDLGLTVGNPDNISQRFDFQGNVFLNKSTVDLYLQAYRGFHIIRPETQLASNEETREDIRTVAFGVNYYYGFNGDKMSLRSAFVGDYKQKRAAGSWLLGGFSSFFVMRADSSIVPPSDTRFPPEAQLSEIFLSSLGVAGGYSHNWVFPSSFYIYVFVAPGIGLNTGNLESDTDIFSPPLAPIGKLQTRVAFGYNGRSRMYYMISNQNDFYWVNLGNDNRFLYNMIKIKASVGVRLWHKNAKR